MPERVLIVEVFVALRQADDPLAQQRPLLMLDQIGVARVTHRLVESVQQSDPPIRFTQQQRPARAGTEAARGKIRLHGSLAVTGKEKHLSVTFCVDGGAHFLCLCCVITPQCSKN